MKKLSFAFLLLLMLSLTACASNKVKIQSSSMEPALKLGEVYEYEKVAIDELKVGDIVYVKEHNLCHRIIEIGSDDEGKFFILKGDNNVIADDITFRYQDITGRIKVN